MQDETRSGTLAATRARSKTGGRKAKRARKPDTSPQGSKRSNSMSNKKEKRCDWALGGNEAYIKYHDEEWGVPVRDDATQFEFLVLESAQAGLSWATVLNRRDGYRKAFANFAPDRVARFTRKRVEKLLEDPGIIRNRAKVEAAVNNAARFLEIQDEFGSFSDYLWGFVDGQVVLNRWRRQQQVPATSPVSDAIAKDLKQRGFKFVGSTIIYAHLQATGLINDHLVGCFRYAECRDLAGAG